MNSLFLDKIFDEQLIVYERDRGTHIDREIVSEREANTQREGGRHLERERIFALLSTVPHVHL